MKIEDLIKVSDKLRVIPLFVTLTFFYNIFGYAQEDLNYRIISEKIKLQVFPSTRTIACSDTLAIRLIRNKTNSINLMLLPVYKIETLLIDGGKGGFNRRNEFIELHNLPHDTLFHVVVNYSGTLSFTSEFSKVENNRAVLREEDILPQGTKALQFVRLNIIVPNGWETIALGNLKSQNTFGDSASFVWEFSQPVQSVGWICAGEYSTKKMEIPIPVSIHVFVEDSAHLSNILSLSEDVLRFYGERFTPYRFDNFSIVEVDNWVAGGNVLAIASPSFVMVKKMAFTTSDDFNQVHSILPHEIAHQWWPLTVFISDQDAALLSEGICEYSAMLYGESTGRKTKRDSLSSHPLLRSLMMRIAEGQDLPLQQKADLRSLQTHYLKAAYVHHMLRRIMGDTAFFKFYHECAKRFKTKMLSLADFQSTAEEVSGTKLNWFFEQWVKKKGIPRLRIYNVTSSPVNQGWIVKGRIRIVGYDKYTTFVDIGVETSSGMQTERKMLGLNADSVYNNDVSFEFITDSKPYRVLLDPNRDILKYQKLAVKFGDLREPSDGLMIIGTLKNESKLLELAQRDSIELEKAGWSIVIKFDSIITLNDLQNDRIFLYGKPSENRIASDHQGKFPIVFHSDSALINGKSIFDTTLTLMQIIQNPFLPHGLLCWIAPLGNSSESELLPFDASWVLIRGRDIISSGSWEVRDEDVMVELK